MVFGRKSGQDRAAGPDQPQWEPGRDSDRRSAAWIGSSVVVEGDLRSSEDLSIAGRVQGDVAVPEHALVIAPKALIHGNVVARFVAVHGRVEGTIRAEQRVEVGESGVVQGDVLAPRMTVAEGATLHGTLRVDARPAPKEEASDGGTAPPDDR